MNEETKNIQVSDLATAPFNMRFSVSMVMCLSTIFKSFASPFVNRAEIEAIDSPANMAVVLGEENTVQQAQEKEMSTTTTNYNSTAFDLGVAISA
jgi:hypothetical protein